MHINTVIRNCVGSRKQKFVATLAEFGQYDTWMTDGFGVQVCVDICGLICLIITCPTCLNKYFRTYAHACIRMNKFT